MRLCQVACFFINTLLLQVFVIFLTRWQSLSLVRMQAMVIDGYFLRLITKKQSAVIKSAQAYEQNITLKFRAFAADECFLMQ